MHRRAKSTAPAVGRRLLAIVLWGAARCAADGAPGMPPQQQALAAGKKPAILVIDDTRGRRDYWNPLTVEEMLNAGYELGMVPRDKTPSLEELKRYNIALVVETREDFATDLQPKLEAFMEQGGGVLVTPSTPRVPLLNWLKSLGATVYLHGVEDEARRKTLDFPQPANPVYIWTDEIAESPLTQGVKTLWYRDGAAQGCGVLGNLSAHSVLLSAPMELEAHWTPLVLTGPDSRTVSWSEAPRERDAMNERFKTAFAAFLETEGRKRGRQPLVAVRNRGPGRLAVVSMFPQDLFWSGYMPARGGVVLRRGFGDRPSDGWKLLDNLYRWLAEPSLTGTQLGGATTDRSQLFRKPHTPPRPYDWQRGAEALLGETLGETADPLLAGSVSAAAKAAVGAGRHVPLGLAGARTAYSSGKGSVADWVTAAKAAGLDFLIFMEDWRRMTPEKWEKLKADCAAASNDEFLAYPGFEFMQENFNRGYFFNRHWQWLDPGKYLTRDGRFIQTSRNVPDSNTGAQFLQLAYDQPVKIVTTMVLGFFGHERNLTPAWAHRSFTSMAVSTRDGERVIDDFADTLPVFLRLQNQDLVISPMALCLMSDPADLAGAVQRGGPFVTLLSDKKNAAAAIDHGGTYAYAGRTSAICATTGPRILTWSASPTTGYTFSRWQGAKREEDFFALENYRYRVRLAVESEAGLKEVLIHDGDQGLYRRFLPGGRKRFEVTLDLSNDRSRHLVPVVKDMAGGVAVAPEIQTEHWANRHYLCADRCNFGTGNRGQGAWADHPGPYTTQQGPETMLMGRWERPVVSADVTILRHHMEKRFETAGAYQYAFGNVWVAWFRTWPMEEMKISRTEYHWNGRFGGPIYYVEEYHPAAIDTMWDFPMPEPFYPENRWTPETATADLPNWAQHGEAWKIELTDDVTLQKSFVHALNETRDYVPGQGAYDFRLGERRVTGVWPEAGAPPLEKKGEVPADSLLAFVGASGQTGECRYITGEGLRYTLRAANGKATLEVGWPAPENRAAKGTVWSWETYRFSGPIDEAGMSELRHPAAIQVKSGALLPNRLPFTFTSADGAAAFRVGDARAIPLEWIRLEVRGLHPRRTAYWHELGTDRIRPIGVDPDGVGRAVLWRGKRDADFFMGHPIRCEDAELWFDAVRMADGTWILDVNNPTDDEQIATFSWHPAWPESGGFPEATKLPPGGRLNITLKAVPQ